MHTAKNKLRQPIFKLLICYGTFVSLFCSVKCMQDNIQVSMLCVVRKLSVQFHKLFIVNFSKNVLIHNSEIYLFSLIFFSLKRWWNALSSSISPSDNIWSTRLSNRSSTATEEDEWGNWIKILQTCYSTYNEVSTMKLPFILQCSQKIQGSWKRKGPPRQSPPSCPRCSSKSWLCGTPVSIKTCRLL